MTTKTKSNAGGRLFDLRLKLMMVGDNPFINVIGGILMSFKIKVVDSKEMSTACINLKTKEISFNEKFANKLSDRELRGLLLHEVMHYLYIHDYMLTTDKLSYVVANIAQDIKINHYLLSIFEELPEEGILPSVYNDSVVLGAFNNYEVKNISKKTSEQIYHELMNLAKKMSADKIKNIIDVYQVDVVASDEKEQTGDKIEKSIEEIRKDINIVIDSENIVKDVISKIASKEALQKAIDLKLIPDNILKVIGWYKTFFAKLKNKLSREVYKLYKHKTPYPKKREYAFDIFVNKKINKGYLVNIYCDTSGSMSDKDIRECTKHVLQISKYADIWFYCFDTKLYDGIKIKNKKDVENIVIKGRGGTTIDLALEHAKKVSAGNKCINILYSDLCDNISGQTNIIDLAIVTKKHDTINAGLFKNVLNFDE